MKRNTVKNYYDILGVSKTASADEIKAAYREMCKTHHPDKGGDQEKMKDINEAYDVLSNPDKKMEYDNPPQAASNPFAGGNPFTFHFSGNPSGFGDNIDLNEILNNLHGFRYTRESPHGFANNVHFHSTSVVHQAITIDLIKALQGGEIELAIPQIGKVVKFNLPRCVQPGSEFRIRISQDNNMTTILSLRVNVQLPNHLNDDQIAKVGQILSPTADTPKTASVA